MTDRDLRVVGKPLPRTDAWEKVTGRARYTVDMALPGMLTGRVLRSPHPHARILSIDASEALAMPGVHGVLTWENVPRVLFNATSTHTQSPPPFDAVKDQYLLDNVVRYVGDEVAAVAADDDETAKRALEKIRVEYEVLPYVLTPEEAQEPEAPDLHQETEIKNIVGGVIRNGIGDIEEGFREAEVVVEETYRFPVQKQGQLETQAALAAFTEDGRYTVWCTTQTPHPTRKILSDIFGLPMSRLRVLNPPYVGGAFGVRIGLSAKAEPLALALCLLTGRPVKVMYDRKEDFTSSETRHGGTISVRLGLKRDGTFTALDVSARMNGGAYASWSADVNGAIGGRALSVYRVPNSRFAGYSVYTNTTLAGAARGFGAPQPTYSMEMTVDKAARALGMDPVEIRRKNIIRTGDAWPVPFPCLSTGLDQCLIKGAEAIGWEDRDRLREENEKGGRFRTGIGVGAGTHISSAFPFQTDYTGTQVTLTPDGTVQVVSGLMEMGTGIRTTLAQIAAEALGARFEDVWVKIGDTDSAYDIGGQASRSLYVGGMATRLAGEKVRDQVLRYAARKHEMDPDALSIRDSGIYEEDTFRLSLQEICQEADYDNVQFACLEHYKAPNALSWHAHFARVRVDTWLGTVEVEKLVAAHDMGRAINPQVVEGQIEGGAVMGLGYGLSEEVAYGPDGVQIQDSYHKYLMPTALDVGEIETILVEANEPSGPYGARGVGENSVAPVSPAVMSAISHALGVTVTQLPLQPWRLLELLDTREE